MTRERVLASLDGGEPFETGSLPPLRLARGGQGDMGAIWIVQVDGEGNLARRHGPDIARTR